MAVVLRDEIERVAGTYVSLLNDSEVEAGAAAAQESLDQIGPTETDTELETRHPWLRHDELCGSGAKPVTNMDLVFQQAFRGEVLPECAPWKIRARQFSAPKRVVLRRIGINRFIGSTVNGEIGLLVTLNIQPSDPNPTRYRCLEYGSANEFTPPFDFAWQTHVD